MPTFVILRTSIIVRANIRVKTHLYYEWKFHLSKSLVQFRYFTTGLEVGHLIKKNQLVLTKAVCENIFSTIENWILTLSNGRYLRIIKVRGWPPNTDYRRLQNCHRSLQNSHHPFYSSHRRLWNGHWLHSERYLVESTKFLLVQPEKIIIIRTTKFLVDWTKLFG